MRPFALAVLTVPALALAACGGANQSFATPVTQPSALAVPDAIQCVKKALEANGYKLGRMAPQEGFIEGQKMTQVVTPDVNLWKKGYLITVWARPAAEGGFTALEMSVVGQEDRRSQTGPRINQVEADQTGREDMAKVATACSGEPPAAPPAS